VVGRVQRIIGAAVLAVLLALAGPGGIAGAAGQPEPATPAEPVPDVTDPAEPCCPNGEITTNPGPTGSTSTGAQSVRVTVPEVTGLTIREAALVLRGVGLWLTPLEPLEAVIVGQDPEAASVALSGTQVRVSLAGDPTSQVPDPAVVVSTAPPLPGVDEVVARPERPDGSWTPRSEVVGGGSLLLLLLLVGLLVTARYRKARRPMIATGGVRTTVAYSPALLTIVERPGRPTFSVTVRPAADPGVQSFVEIRRQP
jgi:hypothetical protein